MVIWPRQRSAFAVPQARGIVPAINLPIFTSGALQSKLAYRNAEYNQQVALYDQTVLNAMRAAADAVSDYQTLQAQALLQQALQQ